MVICFIRLFLGSCFVLIALHATASHAIASNKIEALGKYISSACKTSCVDASLLLISVEKASEELDVNPTTLLAIIEVESSFKHRALNKTNGKSIGLSQIQVKWHRDKFTSTNYYDVFDNVRVGAVIYRDCIKRHKGSRERALWCYNGHQKNGLKAYVPKVLKAHSRLSSLKLR